MKHKFIFLLILLLAFLLRSFEISSNPSSLYWDEVAMGYNVKSIIETGADEYGHKLPFFFESFQDYKLPGYIYSLIPVVKIFGFTPFSIRLPSLLFGIITVCVLYLLSKRLFTRKIALIAAFSLSVSPWHIQFTRAGFEATGALAFLLLGILCLLMGLEKKRFFHIGYISLVIALSFYNGMRIIAPGFFISFIFLNWNKLYMKIKDFILIALISIVFILPIAYQFLSASAFVRFSYTSIFKDNAGIEEMANKRLGEGNTLLSKVFHTKYLIYATDITKNYIYHFSPNFIFFGDNENIRHVVPHIGLTFILYLPLLVIGTVILFLRSSSGRVILVPLLLLAPVAASFAVPSPHALRSISMVPGILLLSALGLNFFSSYFKYRYLFIFTIVVIFLFSFGQYIHEYHLHYRSHSSREWAYGYKEVFSEVKNLQNKYDKIYITGKYWRPYIFALYYLEYPPALYQTSPSHSSIDNLLFGYAGHDPSDPFYNYKSSLGIVEKLRQTPKSLLILDPDEKRPQDDVIKIINDLEGRPLFLFIEISRESINRENKTRVL